MAQLPLSSNASALTLLVALVWLAYIVSSIVYNLYFHPLHKYPGPKLWIAFPIFRYIATIRGQLDHQMVALHTVYGPVIRITPDELSFITVQAWKDIFGHGHAQLPKYIVGRNLGIDEAAPAIGTANDENHARYRKALSSGFSDKALRDQENMLTQYVDLLIEKLKGLANQQASADMVKWYTLTTFDLIGDLTFGRPFDGLKNNEYHSWVAKVFQTLKVIPIIEAVEQYPAFRKILMLLFGSTAREASGEHNEMAKAAVAQRLSAEKMRERPDFTESMIKGGLTLPEMSVNAGVLVIAGSETSASTLSGTTYWLLKTPTALQQLTSELRNAFRHPSEITFTSTARLPYLSACLEEGMRIYTPGPSALVRMTLPGGCTMISGYEVPPNTRVMLHPLAAYFSPSNWHDPLAFHPERWLPDAASDPASPFYGDNRGVFQPFSMGPRNCIGKNLAYNEMRLLLAKVLWHFDLQLEPGMEQWEKQRSWVIWEKRPLLCRLSERKA